VYFSQNQFLNHAAVNPVFSFLSSIGKSGDYIVSYNYMTDDECRELTDSLFYTDSTGADTLLTTHRPNILLIVMESCGGQFTMIGGHPEITPRLNQLAQEGVYFSECYANSWRTDKGMVSILSGYPAFPVTSVMKVPEKSRKMPSIAHSLGQAGYQNTFYYGGDINFTNMRSYVLGTGYDRLVWKADYSSDEQSTCQWGVRDDIMFNTLLTDIQKESNDKPWMKTLLTLSSHEPWDVPTKVLDDEVYNAFNYLDQCIGRFIDDLRKTAAWKNTLIVILPDHGYRYKGIDEGTRLYNHIPLLWVGGAVRQPVVIDRLCNQSDLAATLLGQLGIRHDDFRFSRDITSNSYRQPMAYHNSTSCVSVYDSTGWMAYDIDANSMITQEGNDSERLLRLSRAILQLTSHDLKEK
jgi:phosphoglycerol transferase MdoB-like AlkP superfamily enzyme